MRICILRAAKMAIGMAKDTPQEFNTLKEFTDELDLLFRDDVALRRRVTGAFGTTESATRRRSFKRPS